MPGFGGILDTLGKTPATAPPQFGGFFDRYLGAGSAPVDAGGAAPSAFGAPAAGPARGGGPAGPGTGRAEAALVRLPNLGFRELGFPAYRYGTEWMPHYDMGGTHPGGPALVGEEGPEVVDLPPGSSVQPNPMTLLRLIAALIQEMTDEGEIPSYAFGTPDRTAPYMPSQNLPGFGSAPGVGPRSPFRPGGGMFGPAPPPQRGGQGLRGDEGIDRSGRFSGPQFGTNLIQTGIRSGTYDPLGNPYLASMAREQVMSGMGGRERAATLGADIDSGGDPALRAYGRLQARLNTQAEASDAYQNALMDSARRAQEFYQNQVYSPQAAAYTRRDPREPNPLTALIPNMNVGASISRGGAPG